MTSPSKEHFDHIVGNDPEWLHKNVYAEAGAGTGKTSALVTRIVNLLLSDEISPENIVAVTFTVAAASELRQRVREALELRRLKLVDEGDTQSVAQIIESIESLDSAFIGTIHSFAQSLLTERPIEAGLPPVFEVSDPVQSEQSFDQAWSEWLEIVLDEPAFQAAVINLQMLGLHDPLKHLYDLALEFRANYDLVEATVPLAASSGDIDLADHLKSIQSDFNQAINYAEYCDDPEDGMNSFLSEKIAPLVRTVSEALAADSTPEHIIALTQIPEFKVGRTGRVGNWRETPAGDKALVEVRNLLLAARATAVTAREIVGEQALVTAANRVADMVLRFSDSQREAGVVDFQDLLVLSCRMLEQNSGVRSDFQQRYTRILIDEFQDTDPLQLKLAILLSSTSGTLTPDPGRLFVVGDPKQSIYRFRRADLTQLSTLVQSLKSNHKNLSHNYRSHRSVLDWVNQIFEPWFNTWSQDSAYRVQADYESLEAGLDVYEETEQPRVAVTGDDSFSNVDEAREAEAKEIARLAVSVGSGGWTVTQRGDSSRNSTYRDLAVLFPRRAVLPYLEREFVANGVPYVLEGQTALFESQSIRDLTNCLAAIDDPTDQVAIVASLKSVVWGFSDQDLYDWAKNGRKFDYASEIGKVDDEDSPGARRIRTALEELRELHATRHLHTTADLLELVVRDRRLRELSVLINGDENGIRLVDLFIEMSRNMQNVGTGSVREFVRWVERQMESGSTVAEGALTNSEINAVRVMTIHASKGLEFPIVAVTGLQADASGSKNQSLISEYAGIPELSISLGAGELGIRTANHELMKERDLEAAKAEHARLAYVAATRARDHLVVSVHRTGRQKSTLAGEISLRNSTALSPAGGSAEIDFNLKTSVEQGSVDETTELFDWSTETEWLANTSTAISGALSRGYATPSQLASHEWDVNPKPDDSSESRELDSAQRGRAGTQIGSAVHQVLQDLNLDDLSEIGQLADSAVQAYELDVEPAFIEQKVRNVLEAPIFDGVSEENCIHEAWIAAEIEPEVELEGAVDLLIRHEDSSLTVVDFKTDRVVGEELEKRAGNYAPQLGGYALILESLGMKVEGAVLIFSDGGDDGGYREFRIDDLESAKQRAKAEAKTRLGI